ncbi:CoA transferase [Elstera litoralis]|uniref:CoA transferase n=1 Tax=Elstera litoralis TaxID=552518 RepID=UPI0038B7A891
MDRLGLGQASLAEHHPGLIYCAISGFGATGPMQKRPRLRSNHSRLFRLNERDRNAGDGSVARWCADLR